MGVHKAIPGGCLMRVSCTLNRVLCYHFRWSDTSLMRREMKWVLSRWNHVWTVINILWVLEQLQLTSYFWPPIPIWESLILFLSPISQWTPTDLSYWLLYLQLSYFLFIWSNYHEHYFESPFYFCMIISSGHIWNRNILNVLFFSTTLIWIVLFITAIFCIPTLNALFCNGYYFQQLVFLTASIFNG